MTTPTGGSDPDDPEPQPPETTPVPDAAGAGRLGTSTFTIEGRSAPALFVVGWIASLLGFGLLLVALLATSGSTGVDDDPGGAVVRLALIVVGLLLLSIGLIAAAGSQGIERRARGAAAYAGPSPFLVFAASIPVSILAVIVVGVPLSLAGVALEGPFAAVLSVGLQALVYVALIRLLVVDTGALDWRAMGIRRIDRAALREMVAGAFWALPVIAATIVVSVALLAVFPVQPESPLPPTGEAVGLALSLVAGALIAPLGEEILFRGFATTAWVRGVGVRQGILRAALVFAFAHVLTTSGTSAGDAFGLAVVGFGTRVPIALALGLLFVKRGTIWASFGLHAAFNAVLLLIAEAAAQGQL